MKLHTSHDDVIVYTEEENPHTQYKMAVNYKSFAALTDLLYKNKIGSIVREIASNAYDSHVAANKADVPFEIHLPSISEPYFSIRDFGVGLSDEEVRSIYTTFFQSTKDQSNDALGAYGLGSKSFFCYTTAAAITVVKDNKKIYYSVYMEDGIPTLTKLNAEITDESNGLEFKIAVKTNDFSSFKKEVTDQLKFFKVKPTILNGDISYNLPHELESPQFSSENCILLDIKSNIGKFVKNYAVLGIVGYEIEHEHCISKLPTDLQRFFTESDKLILYKFNIGELDVTLSREAIQYNERTIKSIRNKIKLVRDEVFNFIDESLINIPTIWEKACFLNTLDGLGREYSRIRKLKGNISVNYQKACFEITTPVSLTKKDYAVYSSSIDRKGKLKTENLRNNNIIQANYNTKIFVFDTNIESEFKLKQRLKRYLNNHVKITVIVFKRDNGFEDSLISEFSQILGDVPIGKISQLPLPPSTKKVSTIITSSGKTIVQKIKFNGYKLNDPLYLDKNALESRLNDSNSTKIEEDIENISASICIESQRGIIINKPIDLFGKQYNLYELFLALMKYFDYKDIPIPTMYVFNQENFKEIVENDEWQTLEDYIVEKIESIPNLVNKLKAARLMRDLNKTTACVVDYDWMEKFSEKRLKVFNKNSCFYNVIKTYKLSEKFLKDKNTKLVEIFHMIYDEEDYGSKLIKRLEIAVELCEQRLLLIKNLGYYNRTEEKMAHHIRYINLLGQ